MSSLGENTMCFGENTMCFGENTCVFKSVFIFPINLRTTRKYFGEATYLRTIFQIRRFLCLPGEANSEASANENRTILYVNTYK